MLSSPLLKPASQTNAAVPGTRPRTAFRHLTIAHAAKNDPSHVAATMITITGSGSMLLPCPVTAAHHGCMRPTSAAVLT